MKKTTLPRSPSSAKLVVTAGGHTGTAPAAALVPVQLKLAKILVPIDFSPQSQKALSYALGLADQFGSEITLVHVVEQVFYPTDWVYPFATVDFPERCKTLTEELKSLTTGRRTIVHPVVLLGRPWEEIVDLAKKRKTDLLVIGTHGFTGVKHALLGSVAEKVVRYAPCPVLTVRADERDFI